MSAQRTPCFGWCWIVLALVAIGLGGCDVYAPGRTDTALVVEAFVTTNRPAPIITLRQTTPLDQPSGGGVADATVRLTLGGTTYAYRPIPGRPGRYRTDGPPPTVPPQTPLRVTAFWNGTQATADSRTPLPVAIDSVWFQIPDAPVSAIRVDSLRRDSLDIPASEEFIYPVDVTIAWTPPPALAPADTSYWMHTQLQPSRPPFSSRVVEFFLQPTAVAREITYAQPNAPHYQWSGVYAVPVDSATAPLPVHEVRTALVRGPAAYASFITSSTDPDRREPTSNVEGALGVAVGVAVDSLRFRVAPSGVTPLPNPR
ncbi:DUF4249 domain-containing protein [Salisaeta longa]|uniref:DUF4249 family protein n=1 Tax=Salisaeta longa TaxID=503170 RepID=UPI0004209E4E|nr:DUF4249 family protein [Salisaeta longa]